MKTEENDDLENLPSCFGEGLPNCFGDYACGSDLCECCEFQSSCMDDVEPCDFCEHRAKCQGDYKEP